MKTHNYAKHADAVFAVFDLLRRELADECDDSVVLNRLHEISTLPASEFFAALNELAQGTAAPVVSLKPLIRCAPLPDAVSR